MQFSAEILQLMQFCDDRLLLRQWQTFTHVVCLLISVFLRLR